LERHETVTNFAGLKSRLSRIIMVDKFPPGSRESEVQMSIVLSTSVKIVRKPLCMQ